jgi:hypothetical protein
MCAACATHYDFDRDYCKPHAALIRSGEIPTVKKELKDEDIPF